MKIIIAIINYCYYTNICNCVRVVASLYIEQRTKFDYSSVSKKYINIPYYVTKPTQVLFQNIINQDSVSQLKTTLSEFLCLFLISNRMSSKHVRIRNY